MRTHPWLIGSMTVAVAALPWIACGGGGGSGTGGHASACAPGVFEAACEACVEASCCAEATTCYADSSCNACLTGTPSAPGTCSVIVTPTYGTLLSCLSTKCHDACIPSSTCNPVTNEGCSHGHACDLDANGVYTCFDGPNDAGLCQMCSNAYGPSCQPTMHCVGDATGTVGVCLRYCCDDGDCGGGTCETSVVPGGVGVCLDAASKSVTCGAPAKAPSSGACFTVADAGHG